MESKGRGGDKNIPLKDLKWLHVFSTREMDSGCIHHHCMHPPINTPDTFFTRVAKFLWQLMLDFLMPVNKVLAIKPINLGAAPEPTSGPAVLVDLCLTVGWGYRHFELSFSNLLPSSHHLTYTYTHSGPRSAWA